VQEQGTRVRIGSRQVAKRAKREGHVSKGDRKPHASAASSAPPTPSPPLPIANPSPHHHSNLLPAIIATPAPLSSDSSLFRMFLSSGSHRHGCVLFALKGVAAAALGVALGRRLRGGRL
jgi:hypothetical protein